MHTHHMILFLITYFLVFDNCTVIIQWASSLCWALYFLLLDIRPCWTAGRGSHWSDRPSLSWWRGWEICFRPACNRYDRKQGLFQLYMTEFRLIVSKAAGMKLLSSHMKLKVILQTVTDKWNNIYVSSLNPCIFQVTSSAEWVTNKANTQEAALLIWVLLLTGVSEQEGGGA